MHVDKIVLIGCVAERGVRVAKTSARFPPVRSRSKSMSPVKRGRPIPPISPSRS
jgi:hypothetical protein